MKMSKIRISTKDQWTIHKQILDIDVLKFYTDRSKMENVTGSGVYEVNLSMNIAASQINERSVFQAYIIVNYSN